MGFWGFGVLGYLRTLSLKFQKATSKIEIFLSALLAVSVKLKQPTGQENFNFGPSFLKY